jgi:hypothetical protein
LFRYILAVAADKAELPMGHWRRNLSELAGVRDEGKGHCFAYASEAVVFRDRPTLVVDGRRL